MSFEIETSGSTTKAQVQKELETVIAEFFEDDKPDLTFIVALNLENAVKKFVPYETGVEYKANRSYAIVLGKTIPLLENDHLRFVIIFDARIFENMSPAAFLGRWERIVHELLHVKIDLLRFRATRTLLVFTAPQSKMEVARHNGEVFWEEYAVERTVANWIVTAASKSKSRNDITVNFGETIGFADDVLRDLMSYEGFLREGVLRFQDQRTDLTSLTRSMTETIVGILLRLAKVYAVAEVSDRVKNKVLEIERNVTFAKYFADCWSRVLSLLREYYTNRATYRSDIIDGIAGAYNDVLKGSGIEFEDSAGGYRVRMRLV